MTVSNHVITGAVIGAAAANPLIALPAALFSHILLDVLPHYRFPEPHTSRRFLYALFTDAAVACSLLLFIFISRPQDWQLMLASGILAASPDLWWMPYWIMEMKGKAKKLDPIGHFLVRIQRYERSWGIIVEILWFLAMLYAFLALTS